MYKNKEVLMHKEGNGKMKEQAKKKENMLAFFLPSVYI